MRLTKIAKVLSAYTIASAFSVPVGLIGADILRYALENAPPTKLVTGATFLITVGGPSLAWARSYLANALGVKPMPVVRGIGSRRIPVFGGLFASQARSIFSSPPGQDTLYIAHQVVLEQGRFRVYEPELKKFLASCHSRQLNDLPPFSRTYWVERRPQRLIRHKYNLIIDVLQAHQLIEGRTQGGSGYLVGTPGMVLANLRHWYG